MNSDNPVEATQETAREVIRKLDNIDFSTIVIIAVAALALTWVLRRIIPWIAHKVPARYRLIVLGMLPILRLVITVLAIGLIVPEVVNLTRDNLIVIGGALGVALGFGFKDLISSIIAGVIAIFDKPYRPGDWVKVGDDYGEVKNVGLRAFQMVTPGDDIVTVTHDRVWGANISNSNDGASTLMCVAQFHVSGEHDEERLCRSLREVALTSPYLNYARPVKVVAAEEAWGMRYKLRAYPFDARDQFDFVTDMTIRGRETVKACGGQSGPVSLGVAD